MENSKELIRKRATLKGKVTLFTKYLDNLPTSESLTAEQVLDLQMRTERMDQVMMDFEEIQGSIDILDSDLDVQLAEREQFENSYFAVVSRAKLILSQHVMPTAPPQASASDEKVNEPDIKYPDISLPIFSGDVNEWLEFRDTFDALIIQTKLKPMQKYRYLRSCLKDNALEVIHSIEYSETGFQIAWELLCERFNNTRVLVSNHLHSLFNMESIPSTAAALRNLADNISKHLRSLTALNVPVEQWDLVVIFFMTSKLDKYLQTKWEEKINSKHLPTLQDFKQFLRSRADLLDAVNPVQGSGDSSKALVNTSSPGRLSPTSNKVVSNKNKCPHCNDAHFLTQCQKFLSLDPIARVRLVKRLRLCLNCLNIGHAYQNCKASLCRTCKLKHHTLLHITRSEQNTDTPAMSTLGGSHQEPGTQSDSHLNGSRSNFTNVNTTLTQASTNQHIPNQTVLLSTAKVVVQDRYNKNHTLRVLLDSGSQSNFITKNAFEKLKLPKYDLQMDVMGFNDNVTNISHYCNLTIQSTDEQFSTKMSCFIVPNICSIPQVSGVQNIKIPKRYKLADEDFLASGEIDMILGAEHFYSILCIGQHRLGDGLPILQKTRLGWVVSGPIPTNGTDVIRCNLSLNINNQLSKLFELGDDDDSLLPDDEDLCEQSFRLHTRTTDGNFVVNLPLKSDSSVLGESQHIAARRFRGLEKRFASNPEFKEKYIQSMRDLEREGHMIKLNNNKPPVNCNYLPHHAVIRQSPTTPVRVVFDGSCPTGSGLSLNDIQHKGTIKQDSLTDILLRFREGKYVINADIERMYRCIYLSPPHQHLQCVLWRESPSDKLKTYQLTTLSFGLKSAPYLATRCLLELSNSNKIQFPVAAEVIAKNFYMDDLIYSGDVQHQLAETALQVDSILRSANFKLRKWKSNSTEIMERVTDSQTKEGLSGTRSGISVESKEFKETSFGTDVQKVLGLTWSSTEDKLMYTFKEQAVRSPLTKRKVLSIMSAFFDPLGLIGPVIITAKCFIQRLWADKAGWDDKLSEELEKEWTSFYKTFFCINAITIPRHCIIHDKNTVEIHGFADSSKIAYGAAVYLRSVDSEGHILARLLCAKSRVAPLKQQTIPRLELCAALLLSQLVMSVKKALVSKISRTVLWSDSKIVLAWINTPPHKLNQYVSNRVSKVLQTTKTDQWNWVPSEENPADLLSRGVRPEDLHTASLWWHGPAWLSQPMTDWPKSESIIYKDERLPEIKSMCHVTTDSQQDSIIHNLIKRWSSDTKLIRVYACIQRFIHNTRHPTQIRQGPITLFELRSALEALVSHAQKESFPVEYKALQQKRALPKNSSIISLNPYMENGLIRVGGRIAHTQHSHDKKHPMILHDKHILTNLIMTNLHIRLLHAGPQLLLSSMREKFWPIKGKCLAKRVYHRCVKCFRANPKSSTPIMGDLPTSRITPSPPFHTTGIDYAGPFFVRDRRGRGYKTSKAYVGIFVCFATKAVHIELISSMESAAFVAALRRFIARRGIPKEIVSDNGTTFVGGNKEIQELYQFVQQSNDEFTTTCANEGIVWRFIPVYSPHMGGLWEAAVRSCKYHLKRVLGQALLTYEEFATVLTSVEAMLNSRPLCPITNDTFDVLTPAHFLIGRPYTSLPDYDYVNVPANRLTHFQQLQQLQQNFWRSWSKDYLGNLQQRTKWRTSRGPELTVGTLVLIRDDRLAPCQWRLGRILDIFPGLDNVSRVANIKTQKGILKRAFNNICALPIELTNF